MTLGVPENEFCFAVGGKSVKGIVPILDYKQSTFWHLYAYVEDLLKIHAIRWPLTTFAQ